MDRTFIDSSVSDILPKFAQYSVFNFDIETTGLNPLDSRMLLAQIGFPDHSYVINLANVDITPLMPYFASVKWLKVMQNAKFDTKFLLHFYKTRTRNIFDTFLAEKLLNTNDFSSSGLEALALKYADTQLDKDIRKSFINMAPMHIFSEEQLGYAAQDVEVLWPIMRAQEAKLKEYGMTKISEIEFDLAPVVGAMELAGVPIDKSKWLSKMADYGEKHEQSRIKMNDLLFDGVDANEQMGLFTRDSINLNSPKQIKEAFARLGINLDKGTSERELAVIDHPAAKEMLRYRELQKILTSYGSTFLDSIHPFTQNVHADFQQIGTATGRFACKEPNLQQMPDEFRQCVSKADYKIVAADYAGVELRILAELSGDKNLIKAFASGQDLHRSTAAMMFNTSLESVTDEQRFIGKCFHPDTEVLTKSGWKRIIDINVDTEVVQATPKDNFEIILEWVKPIEITSFKHPSNELVHLKNESIDLRVTPDHRMLVYGSTNKPKVVTPANFSKQRAYVNAGSLDAGSKVVDERLLRLAVATQADGSFTETGKIRFGFSKDRKILRLLSLLNVEEYVTCDRLNQDIREVTINKELTKEIKTLLTVDKAFPWDWLDLPFSQREIVLEEVQYWDGHKSKNWKMYSYYNTSEQSIDVIQAIASITGHKTSKRRTSAKNPNNKDIFRLTIREGHKSRGENVATTVSEYRDEIACISVPSTFVLVRDKGLPLICGQTLNFGISYGMGPYKLMDTLNHGKTKREQLGFRRVAGMHSRYKEIYSEAVDWLQDTGNKAFRESSSTTILGRKRFYNRPTQSADRDKQIASIKRQGANSPVQGSSADMTKLAMLNLYADLTTYGFRASMILQVHDEIVVLAHNSQAEEVRKVVDESMVKSGEQVLKKVPIKVESYINDVWKKK